MQRPRITALLSALLIVMVSFSSQALAKAIATNNSYDIKQPWEGYLNDLARNIPQLQQLPVPEVELKEENNVLVERQILSLSWPSENVVLELDAKDGEIIQFASLNELNAETLVISENNISTKATRTIANEITKHVLSKEEREHYQGAGEVLISSNGMRLVLLARHYFGYPYYGEQLALGIHPNSGSLLMLVNQTNPDLQQSFTLPEVSLSNEEAYDLVKKSIHPKLINIEVGQNKEIIPVWFSGIPFTSFEVSGVAFESIEPANDVDLKDHILLVDRETARKRFADNFKLSTFWQLAEENLNQPVLVYGIKFRPLKEISATVIPATIGEAEFASLLKSMEK